MFSGIVAYRGRVAANESVAQGGGRLCVACTVKNESVEAKDSVAIDGVCLTVTRVDPDALWFDVVPETLSRSTLGELVAGDAVNVEFALRVGERVGGHFVYGHVDAAVGVLAREREGLG